MKAFVMAAGAGMRLRPLTNDLPKPMVPVANKPVLELVLENLKRNGINEAVLNLHHCPQTVKNYFGDGSSIGMKIHYSFEKKLMGTAGGVKKVESFFDDAFVVLSGDGLTDINLRKVLAFHKKKKSFATMVLKPIETKFDYGITITDAFGRVVKFIEKPSWGDVFANTVNTGIYVFEKEVFEYMPKNKVFDFGYQLWPLLLKKKMPIHGYVMDDYWADVGNIGEYRKGVRDALEGKMKINIPGKKLKKNIWVGSGTIIEKGARLNGPCVIGKNCLIGKGAIVDAFSTIGDNVVIDDKAVIKNSILWNDVRVYKNVRLENCVIGNKAEVSENISVFEGTVLSLSK